MTRRAAALLLLLCAAAAHGQESDGPRVTLEPRFMFNQHLYYGSFVRPHGLAFDREHEELWLVDGGDDLVSVFRPDGVELYAAAHKAVFRDPVRVAVAPKNRIAVIEGDHSRVRLLNYRGEHAGDVALPDLGEKPLVGAVTFDASGNLYVAENRTSQIFVYTPDGALKRQFGSRGNEEGQFRSVCGITIGPDGAIYVVDQQALAVQVFDYQGNFIRGWGRHEMGAMNFSLPSGIALDSHGDVFVTDELRHQVKVFSPEGTLLGAAGGLGSGAGQLSFPTDIVIDAHDRVYVAERGNARVQVFEIKRDTPPQ
jgi:DNA-binding beta-propeller fold protein YncE